MGMKYDFGGWATKNDLKCADGRIIRKDAFKDNDGQIVPLVYQHQHNDPMNILGHAYLENREDGVYTYGTFNDTAPGQHAKAAVEHGDVVSLSIYANKLIQKGDDVLHGIIREVSIVLAGANPGAFIDNPIIVHGEGSDAEMYEDDLTEAVIYSDSDIDLYHSENEDGGDEPKEEKNMDKNKTVKDVYDSFTEEEKKVVDFLIGVAVEEAKAEFEDEKEDDEGDENMKHNVFEGDAARGNFLSHADMSVILADGKRCGSLREAVNQHVEGGVLSHIDTSDTSAGVTYATGNNTYGINDMEMLFPEFRNLNNPPQWIKRDTTWVDEFFREVHRTPFSRIKSQYANLTEADARAKGYFKTNPKKEQVFSLLKRTTTPQTIYKKQKFDRDDVIDITDFDVIAWIKTEMRGMLNEEIARACLIGDGRLTSDDDHISEDHIRPVLTDNALFTIRYEVDGTPRSIINGMIRARKRYKGSGSPICYVSTDVLNDMLLLTDETGRDLFADEAALAKKCRVRKFTELEQMENLTYGVNKQNVLAIILNPKDYNLGADKGGAVSMFEDFDIDYNQEKFLIETRCSGALTVPYSAIVILEKVTEETGDENDPEGNDPEGNDDGTT